MTGHEGHQGMMSTPTKTNEQPMDNEQLEVSKDLQDQLKVVLNDYMKIKSALVIEDFILLKLRADLIELNSKIILDFGREN